MLSIVSYSMSVSLPWAAARINAKKHTELLEQWAPPFSPSGIPQDNSLPATAGSGPSADTKNDLSSWCAQLSRPNETSGLRHCTPLRIGCAPHQRFTVSTGQVGLVLSNLGRPPHPVQFGPGRIHCVI